MNKEQTLEAIKVMQAFCDGKPVEFKDVKGNWVWANPEAPMVWNWQEGDYRIKPEPMEIILWVKGDEKIPVGTLSSDTEGGLLAAGWTKKKFREIV